MFLLCFQRAFKIVLFYKKKVEVSFYEYSSYWTKDKVLFFVYILSKLNRIRYIIILNYE